MGIGIWLREVWISGWPEEREFGMEFGGREEGLQESEIVVWGFLAIW